MPTPTTLLEDLQSALKTLAAGGAWYQINETQPPVYPFIVYSRVTSVANVSMAGASNLQNTRIQIDVYSRSASECEAIADSLDAAMTSGPWDAAIPISSVDMNDFETRSFRIVRDFSIWATN